jgi:uncharacterized protein YggE
MASYWFSVKNVALDDVGALISALTETAGDALKINGIGLTPDSASQAHATARHNAVIDARDRAQQLAHAAGVRIGRVLAIEEGHIPTGVRFAVAGAREAAMRGQQIPIEPGAEGIKIRVVVTFEITD